MVNKHVAGANSHVAGVPTERPKLSPPRDLKPCAQPYGQETEGMCVANVAGVPTARLEVIMISQPPTEETEGMGNRCIKNNIPKGQIRYT